ncbi:MarR family winged helix-turn-helix transcriptional regulator [Nonomuraea sp. NPDC050556]|uniref:MarR family winged helix-turn-helix transcriptional regulator n=1 Tax=Nonomuraea sp. NPDC050556 TaxID=3364369 RepID=UPI00378C81E6
MFGEAAPSLIPQLARLLRTALEAELDELGLTTQQGAVLMRVALGENTQIQLAQLVGTDTAGMSRLVDRLVAKGLVTREANPDDRRSSVVVPTEAGKALLPWVMPLYGKVGARLLDGFTEEEKDQATALLLRMRENLRAPGSHSTK